MTPEEVTALKTLSHRGYAVVVFTPEELRGANPHHVEDRLIEYGWDTIDWLAVEPGEQP